MKPISFNLDMTRAILDGRKTQTRRPIKHQPDSRHCDVTFENGVLKESSTIGGCWRVSRKWKPKYQVGDILYVRERARMMGFSLDCRYQFRYEADMTDSGFIEMPERIRYIKQGHCVPNGCFRELARIFLKVTGVRVERLSDMTEGDALAEGIIAPPTIRTLPESKKLWDDWNSVWESCYPGSLKRNDWVFVYEFERCEKP